jgi:predicted nucleotidyltransferase
MNSNILIKAEPQHSVTEAYKSEIVQQLTRLLKGKVEEVFIFGSFFTESFSDQSDLDIIIIKKTNLSFFRRIEEFSELLQIPIQMDILIYTPEEFVKIKEQARNYPGFQRSMIESMTKVL